MSVCRKGEKWSEEEDNQVMKEATEGVEIDEIARLHNRTTWAVKARIMKNALKEENLSLEEVAAKVHISKDDFEIFKQYLENEKKKKAAKQLEFKKRTDQNNISLLTEIRDYLKIIVDKYK